jgi:uncharacterized protein (UPF0303 family)
MDIPTDAPRDLAIIARQETLLQFETFDNTVAWNVGNALKAYCESHGLAVTIEIRLARDTVFFYAMPGTSPNNTDWARRKRNTTELQQRSSYAVGLALKDGETLETQSGLPLRDYAHHGGSFPVRVKGVGYVGTVTISGLPQRDDHSVVVQVLASSLDVSMDGLALP